MTRPPSANELAKVARISMQDGYTSALMYEFEQRGRLIQLLSSRLGRARKRNKELKAELYAFSKRLRHISGGERQEPTDGV